MPAPALREDGTASASKSKMLPRLVALVAIVASLLRKRQTRHRPRSSRYLYR
jgi:hypothetical protein